jgi:8-oxo-dGTP pyrophosphatase MutT (NUDIX family)
MPGMNPPFTNIERTEVALKRPAEVKFLKLWVVSYQDRKGVERRWEYVSRAEDQKVVTIIAHTLEGEILLIKQPRASFNQYIISFPAGLIEASEDVTEAGVREATEETGYVLKEEDILGISPFMAISPGLSSEATAIIEVLIRNRFEGGLQHLEETEDISSMWITPQELYKIVQNNALSFNVMLDAQVWYYVIGIIHNHDP